MLARITYHYIRDEINELFQIVFIYECPTLALSQNYTAVAPLTSKVLGSNGESEGRSIRGFCSGAGFGAAGAAGRQG